MHEIPGYLSYVIFLSIHLDKRIDKQPSETFPIGSSDKQYSHFKTGFNIELLVIRKQNGSTNATCSHT